MKEDRFEIMNLKNVQGRILSSVVHSRSFNRNILLCIWESEDKKVRKLYLSTDIQIKVINILNFYKTRIQVEFCFRDNKQFTGLTNCQSRNIDILHFHFNTSLTSVNLAKARALEKGEVLSMASVKVLYHNVFLMQRFISVLGIEPNPEINRKPWKKGIKFAVIAA